MLIKRENGELLNLEHIEIAAKLEIKPGYSEKMFAIVTMISGRVIYLSKRDWALIESLSVSDDMMDTIQQEKREAFLGDA